MCCGEVNILACKQISPLSTCTKTALTTYLAGGKWRLEEDLFKIIPL